MEILKKADPKVKTALGLQHLETENGRVRLSRFVYRSEKTHVLFHGLTRQMIALDDPEWKMLEAVKTGVPADEAREGFAGWLFSHFYLVPEETEETRFYEQLLGLLKLTGPSGQGLSSYVILPTTACNARCVYCYEASVPVETMDRKTAEKTLRFILDSRKKGRIRLHWFGGEPLAGRSVIRYICSGLQLEKVDYVSEMISNGSLFTQELVEEARNFWHLEKIQISLDGEKEEYLKRKCYEPGLTNPYETVLKNIGLLLKAGIQVSLRCNCDRNNLDSMERMVHGLARWFSPWPAKLILYFSPLNEEYDREEFPDLVRRLMELTGVCRHLGMRTGVQGFSPALRRHHCMADRPYEQCLIDPKGILRDCEHLPLSHVLGNVQEGLSERAVQKALEENTGLRKECEDCVFLPECTAFKGCPLITRDCRGINALRLENVILEMLERNGSERRKDLPQTEEEPLC